MTYRRVLLALVILVIVISGSDRARAQTGTPGEFVAVLGDQAIAMLRDDSLTLEQREERFRALLQNGFDLKLIGRFVLGRYWRQATPEQRSEYLTVFGEFIVHKYSALLGGYSGETFAVLSEMASGEKDHIVRTRIDRPNGAPIEAQWRVRARKGQWRIIDITVEGISMAVTQRAEFKSVVQRNGIDGLIQVLGARVSKVDAVAARS